MTLIAGSAMALAVIVAGALPASASTTPYNTNLVKNPGAESALANPPWDTFPTGEFLTHKYGPSGFGFPPKSEGQRINGGKRFFDGGAYDSTFGTCPDAHQHIFPSGLGSAIDSGHVKIKFRGYAATNGAANLTANLDVGFYDAHHHSDGFNPQGIYRHVTGTNETYVKLKGSAILPKHTRELDVHLWTGPDTEDGCQSSWDNISVVLVHV
jgi:hypothetical protein